MKFSETLTYRRTYPFVVVFILMFTLWRSMAWAHGADCPTPEPQVPVEHALWLGLRMLDVKSAIDNPDKPGAMEAILELGLDSRYYVMVRGWLSLQLMADSSIPASNEGATNPKTSRRIAFLRKAIRSIDLE